MSLAQCPAVAPKLTADAEARAGALTQAYWQALVGDPEPSVDDRARTLMLTYEATDYTDMEWNFCQSRPLFNPAAGNRVCFSNDPRSYLTWGPNGATGGGGREVQLILQAVDAATPSLLDASFGGEAAAVRRMFRMRDGDPARSLETYLCGIWADSARRAAWTEGFAAVGQVPAVPPPSTATTRARASTAARSRPSSEPMPRMDCSRPRSTMPSSRTGRRI